MSCLISSISSGGGSDWVDLPIPASLVRITKTPESGSWTKANLSAAVDELLEEFCTNYINILEYSELRYDYYYLPSSGNRYMVSNIMTVSSILTVFDIVKIKGLTLSSLPMYINPFMSVSNETVIPAVLYFSNSSASAQLELDWQLVQNYANTHTTSIKGRK